MKTTRSLITVTSILPPLNANLLSVCLLTLLLNLSAAHGLPAITIQSFPVVGPNPSGMAFDGTNIWVTSLANDIVTELRASDGSRLSRLTPPIRSAAFSLCASHLAAVLVAPRSDQREHR